MTERELERGRERPTANTRERGRKIESVRETEKTQTQIDRWTERKIYIYIYIYIYI